MLVFLQPISEERKISPDFRAPKHLKSNGYLHCFLIYLTHELKNKIYLVSLAIKRLSDPSMKNQNDNSFDPLFRIIEIFFSLHFIMNPLLWYSS
jgi:hypothetical protein